MIDKVREVALKVLYKIDEEKAYSNIALDEELKINKNKLEERDIGLISEIVYGVTTWKLTLDTIIRKHSNIRIKKISPWILNNLRMGVYQIIFLDKIPKSAAVNESVNLSKRYGHKSSSNFTNAILRKIEKSDYEELFEIKDDIERISKTNSMPVWVIEKLLKENSVEIVEEICKSSNIRPKMHIRVNTLKTNKQEIKKEIERQNAEVYDGLLNDFLIVNKAKKIEENELFKKGMFTVQDEAAGIIPIILNPNENEKVLDACSAPGGKTTYMAEIMGNKGTIEAWDIHEHRTKLIEQTAKRLEINIINTKVKDASVYDEIYFELFDKILLDVPCLGIGVLKRKPDIKWQKKEEDIQEISKIQENILKNCSKYLKKGGELIYSTCSILKEENEKIIEKFLNENENFEIINIGNEEDLKEVKSYVKNLKNNVKNNKYIQIYQNENSDGFFICKLKKIY